MMAASTRLHITPLTRDLLAVLPASIQSSATDISFHSIPTFPENSYGYVTLPTMEAEKFRKKMDGSILKGKKFRVEVARPQKRQRDEAENVEFDHTPVPAKSSKKQRTEDDVLDGYELTDRKVKRGWTESTEGKKERRKEEKRRGKGEKTKMQHKSKYTDKAECLFRVRVPPNRSSAVSADEKHQKRKRKHSKESVVHEFSNTSSFPTFVRSGAEGVHPSATFEQGKGWVDDSGNLKEPASDRMRSDQFKPGQVPGVKEKRRSAKIPPTETNSELKKSKDKELTTAKQSLPEPEEVSDDWTSSSEDTSSDDSASESDGSSADASVSDPIEEGQNLDSSHGRVKPGASSETAKVDRSQSPVETADEKSSTNVHPLEALYKRPAPDSTEAKPSLEVNTQFSFFGGNDIESEEDGEATGPHTPYTKRDMQERGLRSAAPTPDTVLAGRRVQWNESEEEDDASYNTSPIPDPGPATKREESDFAKWFWENRGDNNRAWKKRRRDAAKEERQRENRRKGMKGKS